METTIKETVKNIFKTNTFENALDLTRDLRGEYIHEFGVKSWNGLVTYYKNANITPETVVAESKSEYPATEAENLDVEVTEKDVKPSTSELSQKSIKKLFDEKIAEVTESLKDKGTGGVPFEESMEAFIKVQDEFYATYGLKLGKNWKKALDIYRQSGKTDDTSKNMTSEDKDDIEQIDKVEKSEQKGETVEYMLYQNDGDKVEWYGHYVNYAGLKVGDTGMMVRMNNLGVGKGKVIATAKMTMDEIKEFHKCYASIRGSVASDNKRVERFIIAFNNLQDAMKDPAFSSKATAKAKCDFILNYNSNK